MTTIYVPHTFKLLEDKYNIKKYVKGIKTTEELSEILRYIKKKEIEIHDIGKKLMNKFPYIVNFDLSEVALSGQKPIIYSVKDFTEKEEKQVKLYLMSFLTKKLESVRNSISSFDIKKFNELKLNAYNSKLTTTIISDDILENPFNMSLLWGSYVTYLITKEVFNAPVGEVIVNTKITLLKKLEGLGVNQDEIQELMEKEEWDSKYIDMIKPPLTESYTYDKVYPQGKTNNEKFGYKFKTSKSLETKFRLKNNGNLISCMSDVLYSGDAPFSINICVFFEHTLNKEEEGNLIINISTTSWINSQDPVALDTNEKSSLYICSSSEDNYYARLEVLNTLATSVDENNKKAYSIKSLLSESDNETLQTLLGPDICLNDILENPSKFINNTSKDDLHFAGIPITAHLKSNMNGYAESGLSIKDKTNIFNLVFDCLTNQGLKIEKEYGLPKIKTKDDIGATMKFNSKHIEVNKVQYIHDKVDTIIIAYWTNNDDDFLAFKEFIENLSDKDKGTVKIFKKIDDNLYTLNISNKLLNVRLIKCKTHTMTTLIEPLRGGTKVTPKDRELRADDCKDIIINEFKNNSISLPNKNDNVVITNIFEIPDYHNKYSTKNFDPCSSIRIAFAKLGLNIQAINTTLAMKAQSANMLDKITKLKSELAKKQLELETLRNEVNRVTDEVYLKEITKKIKSFTKNTKDLEKDLEKTLKKHENLYGKDDKRPDIFKSCLLDCLSKKGFTVKLETEKIHQGVMTIFSFAIVEMAGEKNILLLTRYNQNGFFIKDISNNKSSNMQSKWERVEDFTKIANKYIEGMRNNKLEEHQIWSLIENEIKSENSQENVLLISASERKILKDLTNSNITNGIRILKNAPNISIVRINDFNDAPFGIVYNTDTNENGELILEATHSQGLFKKNQNIYYDKSERGDTLTTAKSATKFEKNQQLAARRSIEFCIVSNYLECNDSIASLTSALRKLTIAFGTSTNKPYTLHIIEQLSKEFK